MYPVDLHIYTVVSTHACSTLSDYITQAKQKGTKLFAITDHDPDMEDTPYHWHFVNMHIRPWVVDGVGILRGIEANIKDVDDEADYNGKMSDSLDLIIVDSHGPALTPHDKAVNTRTMIATIASGDVHMISHPGNPKYEIDVKAVVEIIVKHQVALEINSSSFLHSRKGSEDNCRAVATAVRDARGRVALGLDSHAVPTVGELEERLKTLDAVDFPSECISNVSPRRLLSFLKSRGMASTAELADL